MTCFKSYPCSEAFSGKPFTYMELHFVHVYCMKLFQAFNCFLTIQAFLSLFSSVFMTGTLWDYLGRICTVLALDFDS